MSNIFLCSFATTVEDIGFLDSELKQIRLHKSGENVGIKNHFVWNRKHLKQTSFYKKNKSILDARRGAGYFLWKPYMILESLKKIKDGDILIYADASYFFTESDINQAILSDLQKTKGILLYADDTQTLGSICQKSTLDQLKIYSDSPLLSIPAAIASFIVIKKDLNTVSFVDKWMQLCENKELLVDSASYPEYSFFVGHRQDMPLLTLLAYKEGITLLENKYLIDDRYFMYTEDQLVRDFKLFPILVWDKEGRNCYRPFKQFINPSKLIGFIRRKMNWI